MQIPYRNMDIPVKTAAKSAATFLKSTSKIYVVKTYPYIGVLNNLHNILK